MMPSMLPKMLSRYMPLSPPRVAAAGAAEGVTRFSGRLLMPFRQLFDISLMPFVAAATIIYLPVAAAFDIEVAGVPLSLPALRL